MNRIRRFLFLLFAAVFSGGAIPAAVKTEVIEYKDGEVILEGYLAYDDAEPEQRPGVLVIHDWMGQGEYGQRRARQLAELGYVAFAADIYGKGVRPQTPAEAGAQAGKFKNDPELFRRRLALGLEALRRRPESDDSRLAAIGYCFGGTGVLELARSGADVRGVVSFHGGLSTLRPAEAGRLKASVLVCHGADDPHVSDDEIAEFQKEMKSAGADWQMIFYSGAVHSFTKKEAGNNKASGNAYDERADRRSWEHMKVFFDEIFEKKR